MEKIRFSFSVTDQLKEKMTQLSKEKEINLTSLVRTRLINYVKKIKQQKELKRN